MKGIMIAAPNSNSGKTIISAGLISVLKQNGLDITGFKTGPDQVDRKILEISSGKKAGNLDKFLMGEKGLRYALHILKSDYCVIEGVMGCFDGIASTPKNSSFEIAQDLNINIILAYTPSGEMFTMIPKLKGLLEFSEGRIKALILNKLKPALYPAYKKMVEENLDLTVLGFIPDMQELKFAEGNLGLTVDEHHIKENTLNILNEVFNKNIDIKKTLKLFKTVKTAGIPKLKKTNAKVAIAMDDAVNLYYSENIFLFENYTEVKYFSPLKNTQLPDCDILYFGSGNIKNYVKELSENKNLKKQIKDFSERGGIIIAESESVSYLFETFDGYPMCGVFKGFAESTKALNNFGYKIIEFKKDCALGRKGSVIHAAEYHKSKAVTDIPPVFKVTKPIVNKNFEDGFAYKNSLVFFQNINFISCLENFNFLINLPHL